MNLTKQITRIVLTGGPCGGKTSGLTYLRERLESLGYIVLVVPEAASICINAGLHPNKPHITQDILQRAIMQQALETEATFLDALQRITSTSSAPAVILYDRGVVDGCAYEPPKQFLKRLLLHGTNTVQARDGRYDAVLHMVTAADGAKHAYTLANNTARLETAEQAIEKDRRTRDAWIGHPHLRIIDNSTDFEGKLLRLFQEVSAVLGIPIPIERERKFLVAFEPWDLPPGSQVIDIEQRYLITESPDVERRIRKRGQHGYYCYYHTEKREHKPGERFEHECQISEAEYYSLARMMRPDTRPVKKQRTCFLHDSQYFELDVFESKDILPKGATGLLEIEITNPERAADTPQWFPFIHFIQEVTNDPRYSNASIAKRLAG